MSSRVAALVFGLALGSVLGCSSAGSPPAASGSGGATGGQGGAGAGGSGAAAGNSGAGQGAGTGGTSGLGGSAGTGASTGSGGDGAVDASTAPDASGRADAAARDARAGVDAQAGGAGSTGAGGPGDGGGTPPPDPITTHLAIGVHDPSMMHVGTQWYLFATGGTLGVRSSTNMTVYTNAGNIFARVPAWVNTELGATITALWAPDISFFSGKYHVYYAGSTFGSNHSVIGLATNTTLDRNAAGYAWVDEGLVVESNAAGSNDNWNAIDPNVAFDTDGNVWLAWGSFGSGIKLRQLDPATGMLSTTNITLYSIAGRNGGAIEAASIVYHGGFYYLFVSYDRCCLGVDSTYRTMVGRATAITGPYTDRAGAAMLQGNAEQLLATDGRYIGPGGGTAFHDGDYYYYAYHYYDGMSNGDSRLAVRPITFDADNWVVLGEQLWQ